MSLRVGGGGVQTHGAGAGGLPAGIAGGREGEREERLRFGLSTLLACQPYPPLHATCE